jgi:hypothetical protein
MQNTVNAWILVQTIVYIFFTSIQGQFLLRILFKPLDLLEYFGIKIQCLKFEMFHTVNKLAVSMKLWK